MIGIGYKKIRSPTNSRKSFDISYTVDNTKEDQLSKINLGNQINMSSIAAINSVNTANNSLIRSASQKSYLIRNYGYSPIYRKDVIKEAKVIDSPQATSQNKKLNFSKIGIDVLNSNRVLMNFNKKNYLGSSYINRHIRVSDSRKPTIKQNNIIIKDAEKKESGTVSGGNSVNTSVISEINIEDKKNNSANLSLSKEIKIDNSLSYLSTINEKTTGSRRKNIISNDNLKLNLLNKITDENLNLDNCVNFLRDLNNEGGLDNQSFVNHLRLFESYLEVEFSMDIYSGNSSASVYFPPGGKRPSLLFSLKKYFSILKEEYGRNKNSQSCSEFFLFESLNKLYLKSLKLQIILLSVFFVCSTHVILDTNIKTQIKKLMVSLTGPVVNIFELFIYNQVLLNYNEIIAKELKVDFGEKYSKVYKNYRLGRMVKLSDTVVVLNKNLESLSVAIKQFSGY
jgi:hypothetical protein